MQRFWAKHRNACLLSLFLVVVGVTINPWLLIVPLSSQLPTTAKPFDEAPALQLVLEAVA